jgi:16S rRNA processing protein RimM
MTPGWDDLITVGRIARPHALRGEVAIAPVTDFVEDRFQPGRAVFVMAPSGVRQLEIASVRFHQGRPLVAFEGVEGIDAAEALGRGEVRMAPEALGPLPEATFYHHDLVGCEVVTRGGTVVGQVRRVEGAMTASLLVVAGPRGEVLVPLVADICVSVEPAARRIVVSPPEGLLELNG